MAVSGVYYPPPPVFIGGCQPYAPRVPVSSAPEATFLSTPTIARIIALHQAVQAWRPTPIIVVWTGPVGSTATPPVPLNPESISLGQKHLSTVLMSWVSVPFFPILPKPPVPMVPAATGHPVAPGFSPGQRALFSILPTWAPGPWRPIVLRLKIPEAEPPGETATGGGRLIGPNRLNRA